MPTEPKAPGRLDLECTAEMPTLPGHAAPAGADGLAATDSWRILPPLGDERIGPTEQTIPEYDRVSLERALSELTCQLGARDGRLAALESQLAQRDAQLRDLEGQLAALREELARARTQVEELQARDAAPPAAPARPDAVAPQRLLVRTEGDSGIVHVLSRRTTVGRTPDNDLRVEADFVSRHHAVLLLAGADTVVEDLHSTNGTFVNGEPVVRRTLREGDLVGFGKLQYRFVIKPA
jgi:uncharacterized coiled-coil protein SlyX